MKKVISAVLAVLLLVSFAACGKADKTPTVKTDVNVFTLKGPTGMGMAKLTEKDSSEYNNYNITLSAQPTELAGLIANGSVDIAACPLNLAAALYKKTNGAIKLVGINTLGVLYIIENGETVTDLASLKGKTIYASGQGATPEYALNYLLEKNGINKEDVDIVWKSEHSEVAALVASGEAKIALLPEPNVTAVTVKNPNVRIAVDITKEWEKVSDAKFAMGCIIATKAFADEHPDALKAFLEDYKKSVDAVNENTDEICELVASSGIVPSAAVAKKAIPNCNIVLITGDEMKKTAQSNFEVLFNADPKSIGGSLPDENLYFIEK